jgi:hypothetical protein
MLGQPLEPDAFGPGARDQHVDAPVDLRRGDQQLVVALLLAQAANRSDDDRPRVEAETLARGEAAIGRAEVHVVHPVQETTDPGGARAV